MGYGNILASKLSISDQVELISNLHRLILELAKSRHIILFGSAARREMTTASDLDVVVIVDRQDQVKATQRALNQLSRLISWPVDCLVIDQDLFEKRSQLGGLYAVVKEEGVFLPSI